MDAKIGYIYKIVPPDNNTFYIKITSYKDEMYTYIVLQGSDVSSRKGFDKGSRFEDFIEDEFSEDAYLAEIL